VAKDVIAIYPGTFDPPTYGHLDIIERASRIYQKVIVAVATGSGKNAWFPVEERKQMLKSITKQFKNVEIDSFNELLVSYAKRKKALVIVRGLRALSDFEYEFQMALTNRSLASDIETVFLMTHEKYSYLSSSLIKEISSLNGDLKKFVPKEIESKLKKRNIK
jgi:pantetheine-phosphate adenylyltransferase